MEIKNPGRRFSFLNDPGSVRKYYHKSLITLSTSNLFSEEDAIDELAIVGQLWVNIRVFELTLRSFINNSILLHHKDALWWRNESIIKRRHLNVFQRAKNAQGFTFSSLVLLFSKSYKKLWHEALEKSLIPSSTISRSQFHSNLEYIRQFRNIIAHHEPLNAKNVLRALEYMVEVLDSIDPIAAEWLVQSKNQITKDLNTLRQ